MDASLLDILACPVCKGTLVWHKTHNELHCSTCALAYPIQDDIPVMLPTQARDLSEPAPQDSSSQ